MCPMELLPLPPLVGEAKFTGPLEQKVMMRTHWSAWFVFENVKETTSFRHGNMKEDKSYILGFVLLQPTLPHLKLRTEAGQERIMLVQHNFEAANLARMHCSANTTEHAK